MTLYELSLEYRGAADMLRTRITELERACREAGCRLYLPPLRLCGDNAAMIGAQGYYESLLNPPAGWDLNAYASMDISQSFENR